MKFAILPCKPAHIGLIMISLCVMLGFLTAIPAAAQDEGDGYTKITVPLGDNMNTYAELTTILPSEVSSEAYSHEILNYTGGRDVRTSILLDGSMVTVYLLYPCEPTMALLDAESLKSVLATADDTILQANYTESFLNISGRPTIGGQLGASVFAAYQPTNQTAALIVMADSLDLEIMAHLLYNMTITVDESMNPIPPGYCSAVTAASDVTGASSETAAISANATESAAADTDDAAVDSAAADVAIDDVAAEDTASSTDTAEVAATDAAQIQNGSDSALSRKDKAEADRKAAMAKLEEARANMRK